MGKHKVLRGEMSTRWTAQGHGPEAGARQAQCHAHGGDATGNVRAFVTATHSCTARGALELAPGKVWLFRQMSAIRVVRLIPRQQAARPGRASRRLARTPRTQCHPQAGGRRAKDVAIKLERPHHLGYRPKHSQGAGSAQPEAGS